MMKIAMFNVKDEEIPLAQAWAEEHQVEVQPFAEHLSHRNVDLLKDCDGLVIQQVDSLEEEVYARLKEYGIKQIAARSAGFDMINMRLADKYGLIITHVPSYSPESIAEFGVTLALELLRKTQSIHDHVARQDFRILPSMRGRVLGEMKVAIIGTGHIGRAMAHILKGFGCDIVAYDLKPVPPEAYTYAESIEEAIQEADLVSLHLPLNDGTEHLFNREVLSQMKAGSYLINMSRGGLIDTEALLDLVEEGHLAGAALDVYEQEAPYVFTNWQGQTIEDPTFQRLLDEENVIFTPHIAYYTDTSIRNLVTMSLDAALEVIKTGHSDWQVQ